MEKQEGFTLIEILVVVTVIALLVSVGSVSFNQLLDRRQSANRESLLSWLQAVRDRAQLEGAVYGVTIEDSQVRLLAYREGYWLTVLDYESWEGSEDVLVSFEASDADQSVSLGALEEETMQPEFVFLPDGTQWPEGRIGVATQDWGNWISVDSVGQFEWSDQ